MTSTGYGYRVWMVKDFRLTSIAVPSAWHAGVNKATCLFTPRRPVYRVARDDSSGVGGWIWEETVAPSHEAPSRNCMCGLWSVCHLERADAIMRSHLRRYIMELAYARTGDVGLDDLRSAPPFVTGAVRYWGRTAIHENGVRAEYAQPIALATGGADTEILAQTYDWGAGTEILAQTYDIPCLATKEELASYVESQIQ